MDERTNDETTKTGPRLPRWLQALEGAKFLRTFEAWVGGRMPPPAVHVIERKGARELVVTVEGIGVHLSVQPSRLPSDDQWEIAAARMATEVLFHLDRTLKAAGRDAAEVRHGA